MSRNCDEHIKFVREELFQKGILRQGRGYDDKQDLRKIFEKQKAPDFKWTDCSEDELGAWGHRCMIGDYVPDDWEAFKIGDTIFVSNVPENGFFTLCRVAGRYYYSEQTAVGDLRHAFTIEMSIAPLNYYLFKTRC